MSESALIRFTNKYIIDPNTGCWLWTGVIHKNGYGSFKLGSLTQGAHIFSYEHYVGPVPNGLELDHIICDTRPCCNYAHLRAVTHLENIRRGRSGEYNRVKTHCKNGHEFTVENTVVGKQRTCRTCSQAASRRYEERCKATRRAEVV